MECQASRSHGAKDHSRGSAFVSMVQAAHLRKRDDAASLRSLHWPRHRRILLQSEVRSALVIVGDEGFQVTAQRAFVDNDLLSCLRVIS